MPRLMRRREVEVNAQFLRHVAMQLEFPASVGRYRVKQLPTQRLNQRRLNFLAAKARQLLTLEESTFPIHQSQQSRFTIKADNGISFPIARSCTLVRFYGTFRQFIANRDFPTLCHLSLFDAVCLMTKFYYAPRFPVERFCSAVSNLAA